MPHNKVDLTIRGRQYSLACAPESQARLQNLAQEAEGRLNKIARSAPSSSELTLLTVCLLTTLDELQEIKANQQGRPALEPDAEEQLAVHISQMAEKVQDMAKKLVPA